MFDIYFAGHTVKLNHFHGFLFSTHVEMSYLTLWVFKWLMIQFKVPLPVCTCLYGETNYFLQCLKLLTWFASSFFFQCYFKMLHEIGIWRPRPLKTANTVCIIIYLFVSSTHKHAHMGAGTMWPLTFAEWQSQRSWWALMCVWTYTSFDRAPALIAQRGVWLVDSGLCPVSWQLALSGSFFSMLLEGSLSRAVVLASSSGRQCHQWDPGYQGGGQKVTCQWLIWLEAWCRP